MQAGVIAGGHRLGARVQDGASFSDSIALETSAFLMAKVPPKPQHCSRLGKLDQIDPAHGAKKHAWAVAEVQAAQAVATGVIGDAMREVRADVFEPKRFVRNSENSQTLGRSFDLGNESWVLACGFELARHRGIVVAHHARRNWRTG